MSNLYDLLKETKSLKKTIFNIEIAKKIKANWEGIFGNLAKDLKFSYLKNQTLYVEALNYLWVTEINFFKKDLIKKINLIFNKPLIQDIKVFYQKETLPQNKNLLDNKSLKSNKKLNLADKIKMEQERKIKEGYRFCTKCKLVLTKDVLCFLCKNL